MGMFSGPGEPAAGPWQVIAMAELLDLVFASAPTPVGRPWIVAVDGRSGSGKTTLADRLHRSLAPSAIVHTDDIAWHHDFFDWSHLLIDGVLRPLSSGQAVSCQPPGWLSHGRSGAVTVPAGQRLVNVEGVGSSRVDLLPWLDGAIWVQADFHEAERRGLLRDGGTDEVRAFWQEWMNAEVPFFHHDRPWERATIVVAGTPTLPHDATTQVVVAPSPGPGSRPN